MLLVVLAWATNVSAHKAQQVRSDLESRGYDRIEFKRTKPPFRIEACLGEQLFDLRVDFYGKITKKTVTGTCPGRAAADDGIVTENSSIATADGEAGGGIATKPTETSAGPEAQPKAAKTIECKRYFPATGMTHTVPCD